MSSEFVERLDYCWQQDKFVCVGLDPDLAKIPQILKDRDPDSVEDLVFRFNQEIVDATHDLVCAYKPNSAFYEALGAQGLSALARTVRHIKDNYPDVSVIFDGKRGDIGNTNQGYVHAAFDELGAHAATVNPYFGAMFFDDAGQSQFEALKPFLERKDKGIIALCRTSNKSAGEFQDLPIDLTQISSGYRKKFGEMEELRELVGQNTLPLYQIVAYRVSKYWNTNGNCALVVGAPYPEELAQTRRISGMPFLVPGVGAQQADVRATVEAGMDGRTRGMIVNSSRGIIFASNGSDFAFAARQATEHLSQDINKYRTNL